MIYIYVYVYLNLTAKNEYMKSVIIFRYRNIAAPLSKCCCCSNPIPLEDFLKLLAMVIGIAGDKFWFNLTLC